MLLPFCSCVSIKARLESRNFDPPIYLGTLANIGFISKIKLGKPGGGGGTFDGLTRAIGNIAGLIGIVDFPFSLTLDTLLLPTDLLFGPGAIIAKEPSKFYLYRNMQDAAYNAYSEIAKDVGVRYTLEHHGYSYRATQSMLIFTFILDSDIEGFSEKGQVLYEIQHTRCYWKDEKGDRKFVYSVFWLNPKNQRLLFQFLPSKSNSIQHSVFASSREHSKSIRKYFSERLAVEVCFARPKFPNYRDNPNVRMTGEEATNAVVLAREKYREITGDYPAESLNVFATMKFVLFDGDVDPPPKSFNNHRVEVLITEPSQSFANGILKAMFWIEPTTNANVTVEVLYPIIR